MSFEFIARNGIIALNNSQITGSLNVSGGITGSLLGTASFAVSASYAVSSSYASNATSASYALNTTSASYAATSSYANNFTASNILVSGDLTAQTIHAQYVTSSVVYSSGSNTFGNNLNNIQQFTGSVNVTGSLNLNGNPVITGTGATGTNGQVAYFNGTNAITSGNGFTYNTGNGIISTGGASFVQGQAITPVYIQSNNGTNTSLPMLDLYQNSSGVSGSYLRLTGTNGTQTYFGSDGIPIFTNLTGIGNAVIGVNANGKLYRTTFDPANTGTVTSVGGTGTVSGITLTGTVTTSGNLTLGGSISGLTTSNLSATAGITNAQLANSTISGIALGSNLNSLTATNTTLTFSGAYNGSTAQTVGLNLSNVNTWAGQQIFNATAALPSGSWILFNGSGDNNWRMGIIGAGGFTTTAVGNTTTIQTVIGTGTVGPDGWAVGQTGGSSIFELKGSDKSAYFYGAVKLNNIAAGSNGNNILVTNSGIVSYRTPSQILTDIGAQGSLTLTTTGSSGAATLVSNTLNIPTYTLLGLGGISAITLNTPNVIYNNPINFTVTGTSASGTLSLNTQTANTVFAGPSTGTAATPTFRGLVIADLPTNIPNANLANSSLTVTAGTGLSGGGLVSLGGTVTLTNAGVTSITGTANQVTANTSTGAVTLSLPQNIATTSTPTFGALTITNNATAANFIDGYTTTVTSASTVTLTTTSTCLQYFTGSTAQTVKLPLATSSILGQSFILVNLSSQPISLQTNGGAAITTIPALWYIDITCISTGSDVVASWNYTLSPNTLNQSGWIQNSYLANSAITINGTSTSLGGSINVGTVTSISGTGTVSGLTLSGTVTSSGSLTFGGSISGLTTSNLSATAGILNTQLANSSITVNGTAISLGGSATINAATTNGLTFSNGGAGAASGTIFNGASAITVSYNTVGAPSTSGTNATGTWGINITGNASTATNVGNSFILKFDGGTTEGTDLYTFNGGTAKTINYVGGTNITLTKAAGQITITNRITNNNQLTNGAGYITGNQTITLSGDVSGSGATAITTTIGAGKVTNSMLAGSIAASKLVGTDIATVGTITTGIWNAGAVTSTSNGLFGGSTGGYATANRGIVQVNGTLSSLLGLGVGNVNKGYMFSDGTNMIIENQGTGTFSLANNGTTYISLASGIFTSPVPISITNSTASTSTTTGALVVTGGVGIGGAINVGASSTFRDADNTFVAHFSGNGQTRGIAIGTSSANVAQIQGYINGYGATNDITLQPNGGVTNVGGALNVGGQTALNGTALSGSVLSLRESSSLGTAVSMTNRNSTQQWALAVDKSAVDDKIFSIIDQTNAVVALALSPSSGNATFSGSVTAANLTANSNLTVGGILYLSNGNWHVSAEGAKRFFFQASGNTYFGSQNNYIFRSPNDALDLLTITSAGAATFLGSVTTSGNVITNSLVMNSATSLGIYSTSSTLLGSWSHSTGSLTLNYKGIATAGLQIDNSVLNSPQSLSFSANISSSSYNYGDIRWYNYQWDGLIKASISAETDGALSNGALVFKTGATGSNATTALRINSSGNLISYGTLTINRSNGNSQLYFQNNGTGDWDLGTQVGDATQNFNLYNRGTSSIAMSINKSTNAATYASSITATTFYSSSDARLKNIVKQYDIFSSDNLSLTTFTRKDDPTNLLKYGYTAQNVLLSKYKSAAILDADGYYTVDYVGIHTAKIQKLEEEVILLKEEIKRLKHG
jgi:hypothetical protein